MGALLHVMREQITRLESTLAVERERREQAERERDELVASGSDWINRCSLAEREREYLRKEYRAATRKCV